MAGSAAAGAGVLGGLALAAVAVAGCVGAHRWLDADPVMADPQPGRQRGSRERVGWPARALVGIGSLCLLAFMTEGGVADWAGVFLREVAGFGATVAASGLAAFSTGMIVARLLGDGWVRRFGAQAVLRLGAGVAAAGVGLAMLMPEVGPVGFGLVGLGGANVAPILFSTAGRVGPAGIAAVATLGYAGMLVGPPVIGAVAEWAGLRIGLGVLVVAMGVIGVAAGRITVMVPEHHRG